MPYSAQRLGVARMRYAQDDYLALLDRAMEVFVSRAAALLDVRLTGDGTAIQVDLYGYGEDCHDER